MSESGIYPKFYLKSVQHTAASREAGRPIFRDIEWVDIIIAGDKNCMPSRKVSDADRLRFPVQYNAFQKNQEAPLEGTPLKEWAILTPAQVSELNYLNFYTVESIAEMPDTALQTIGLGGRELKNKAIEWLKSAENGAVSQKLIDENAQLRQDIDMLKDQIALLGSAKKDEDTKPAKAAPKATAKKTTAKKTAAKKDDENLQSSLASGV